MSQEPHDRARSSSEHSKFAVASLEENAKVAVGLGVEASGPDSIVVSGTTSAEAGAIANGDRPSVTPHAVPGQRVGAHRDVDPLGAVVVQDAERQRLGALRRTAGRP